MSKPSHCAECGAALPADWPKALCPRCALEGALDMDIPAKGFPSTPPTPASTQVIAPPKRYGFLPKLIEPAIGAALTVLCGLALWHMPLGESWRNASYDYLFRFAARPVTNQVVLIFMDNEAAIQLQQKRNQPWDRALHAQLVNRLAADKCSLVVFDVGFYQLRDEAKDQALATALARLPGVALMGEISSVEHPDVISSTPVLPAELFLRAAHSNWGVALVQKDADRVARRHFVPPKAAASEPEELLCLSCAAARSAGVRAIPVQGEQWLRYYGERGPWESLSYHVALAKATNYFSGKTVFIGQKPETTSALSDERDKFGTPYTRWNQAAVGGVEILATTFLNLVNGDSLRRFPGWVEALVLAGMGILLGAGLCKFTRWHVLWITSGFAVLVAVAVVWMGHITNYWFPWLIIVGGQAPCALVFALVAPELRRKAHGLPDAPDYELFEPVFAEGAYGKVWLARNAIGQWQALKAVYQSKFGSNREPYEREFKGIMRYKPVSDKHPALLRVDFVSRKKPTGYFYYVMELGDSLTPGWEKQPALYQPCDLARLRARAERNRLPVSECVRLGLTLADALEFLHGQGLTHRDIKPQNIIFVKGQPKLADVGLVAEILPGKESSLVGTPSYMPPAPEPTGTPPADIYGLGMVLYVISTGRDPDFFPELSQTLAEHMDSMHFIQLNQVILKACQPDLALRYASAAELRRDLLEIKKQIEGGTTATPAPA